MKDNFWVEEYSGKPPVYNKRKRRVGKKKIEFVGWGSRPLIEFLESIGQDTKEKHSRHEVAAFITKYINDKGLASVEKKKKVDCDERLYDLFGKKSVSRIRVYDLLEEHFAENHDDDDSDDEDSSDDEDYGERNSLGSKKNPNVQMKKVLKIPKSCFAAIISENIKLIYLKKSVIHELLKFPESFEYKIVRSFVRVKSDPNDIYQKNRFQLQQVTGIEKVAGAGDSDMEICLRVSNFFRDIPIGMLSDDIFSEEEVEDVRDRIKAGSLDRLTVKELQLKAQVLHVDIIKNWIAKEISLLQRLIEHASEKGWQRQKFEYLERRKMLQTPSEHEKMMLMIPEVISEDPEPESVVADASEKTEENACSPKSILKGSSDASNTNASESGEIVTHPQVTLSDTHALKVQNGGIVLIDNPKGNQPADTIEQGTLVTNVISNGNCKEMQAVGNATQAQEKPEQPPDVIDLSNNDSEDDGPMTEVGVTGENPNAHKWFYLDPHGKTQGPFPLFLLKQWSDANYFHPGFTVWKVGQTLDDRVLLVDVLHHNFLN